MPHSDVRKKLVAFILLCVCGAVNLKGIILSPDAILASPPAGSNDTTNPFTDDLLLENITFEGATFDFVDEEIIAVQSVFVSSGRDNINAEWGDNDTDSDGNPTPFDRLGLNPTDQEIQDPTIQDLGLASAFSSSSLSEGSDGEGTGSTFRVIFNSGISDNDSASDLIPEIIIFERNNNDTTSLRAIIGGTFMNPILAPNTVTINPGDLFNTGFSIDTTEIGSPQELAVGGIDLSDFGATGTIFGLEITTDGGDLSGIFASTENLAVQTDPNVPTGLLNPLGTVPEPRSFSLLLGLVSLFWVNRRRH